jgi:hypothetical protein
MRTFSMPAARSKLAIVILGFVVLLGTVMAAGFLWVTLGSRTVTVERDRIKVEGALYSDELSRDAIDRAGVRVVDLDHAPELALSYRSNGLGLPGLKEGWFKMENGKRAFLMLTDTSRVVVVPSSKEWLLLSVPDGERLVEKLK